MSPKLYLGVVVNQRSNDENLNQEVIDSFGLEWAVFNYVEVGSNEALDAQFRAYCAPIDLNQFSPRESIAADFGAGSGRWTSRLIPFFSLVYALEPSEGASEVLKKKFSKESKVVLLKETIGANSIPIESLDLAVSFGVLHHIPDTSLAIKDVSNKIKPGGTFLCYLYYNLENKPLFYRLIFNITNLLRRIVSALPHKAKFLVTFIIAAIIYWPMARFSKFMYKIKLDTTNIPLHQYADMPFVMLANDALDRFGTSLEQRFSKNQIIEMLQQAGFDINTVKFSDREPFWTFSVKKN